MNNCSDKVHKLGSALNYLEIANSMWDTYVRFAYNDQKLLKELESIKASALENAKKARADLEKCLKHLLG